MKYPAVASLILRTLHTISVLINKKSFLLAHFIIRGAAKMQTHLTGWEFTSVIFPGSLAQWGPWAAWGTAACTAHAPTPCLGFDYGQQLPPGSPKNCPSGCHCQAATAHCHTIKSRQIFLGLTIRESFFMLVWPISQNSAVNSYFTS